MEQEDRTTAGLWLGATLLALGVGIFVSGTASKSVTSANESTSATQPAAIQRFRVPVTSTQPSLGPREALVTIVEWCSLRGQACRDSDRALRTILSEHPKDVRRVYRHLPTRQSVPSQLLHHVAHGVHAHAGKFWELRALVSSMDDSVELDLAELRRLVEQVHADWEPIERGLGRLGYAQHVNADVTFAERFGVDAAPGIFVNGRHVPIGAEHSLTQTLRSVVREEIAVAKGFVARGVALSNVYDEITRDGQWTAGSQSTSTEPSAAQPALQSAIR